MKILTLKEVTDKSASEPLYSAVFDDFDAYKELINYTDYEYVENLIKSFPSGPSSHLRKVYKNRITDYSGTEEELWINEVLQEADFYLNEINDWIDAGKRPDNLKNCMEDLKQNTNIIPDTTIYLLKGKAYHFARQPIVRLYLIQIGVETDDPEWILLLEGIKFEYNIDQCPGVVSTVFRRAQLAIDKYIELSA